MLCNSIVFWKMKGVGIVWYHLDSVCEKMEVPNGRPSSIKSTWVSGILARLEFCQANWAVLPSNGNGQEWRKNMGQVKYQKNVYPKKWMANAKRPKILQKSPVSLHSDQKLAVAMPKLLHRTIHHEEAGQVGNLALGPVGILMIHAVNLSKTASFQATFGELHLRSPTQIFAGTVI